MSGTGSTPVDPGEMSREVNFVLGADTLRRVGTLMYYLGAVGVVVWALETYSAWDTVNDAGFVDGELSRKVALVLGQISTLLLSALVVGVGSIARLLADWAVFRLDDGESEDLAVDNG